MAVFRVERNKGYTVMSNHHLRKITAAQHRANRIRSFCAEPYGGCAMTLSG